MAGALRAQQSPGGVVLAGAAGVGKTRLAREAVQRAAPQGAAVRWAYATVSARSTPLGAFEGLLGDLGSDPAQRVRRAVTALGASSGAPPLAVVDDAHESSDELSAIVVHSLVVRRAATVLVTHRSGEPAPDAVTALWKDEHLPRLELQALSVAETRVSSQTRAGRSARLGGGRSALVRVRATCSTCATWWTASCDPDGSARWRESGSGPRPRRSAPSWPRSCAARWVNSRRRCSTSSTSWPWVSRFRSMPSAP